MNSRERMLTVLARGKPDHIPLYCWCFGAAPPPALRWSRGGVERAWWYTFRLDTCTLPTGSSMTISSACAAGSPRPDDVPDVSPPGAPTGRHGAHAGAALT